MKTDYLARLRNLLEGLTPGLEPGVTIECKPFFGGAAAYANGLIFMTLTRVGLALKLPAPARERWSKRGARPLRYFPKAPIKKDYVVLPTSALERPGTLRTSVRASLRYVQWRAAETVAESADES